MVNTKGRPASWLSEILSAFMKLYLDLLQATGNSKPRSMYVYRLAAK